MPGRGSDHVLRQSRLWQKQRLTTVTGGNLPHRCAGNSTPPLASNGIRNRGAEFSTTLRHCSHRATIRSSTLPETALAVKDPKLKRESRIGFPPNLTRDFPPESTLAREPRDGDRSALVGLHS